MTHSNNFSVTKTRDGQSSKHFAYISAINFEAAKNEFANMMRVEMEFDDQLTYFANIEDWTEQGNNPAEFDGAGYYNINYSPLGLVLADKATIDTFKDDVYTYQVHNHTLTLNIWKIKDGELIADDTYLTAMVADIDDAREFAMNNLPSIDCDLCRCILTDNDGKEIWVEDFDC